MTEEFQKLQEKIIEKLPKIHLSMESVDDYCYPDLENLFEQFKEEIYSLDSHQHVYTDKEQERWFIRYLVNTGYKFCSDPEINKVVQPIDFSDQGLITRLASNVKPEFYNGWNLEIRLFGQGYLKESSFEFKKISPYEFQCIISLRKTYGSYNEEKIIISAPSERALLITLIRYITEHSVTGEVMPLDYLQCAISFKSKFNID